MSEVPDLDFPWPTCTVCKDGGDMDYDPPTWWCNTCGNEWRSNGQWLRSDDAPG